MADEKMENCTHKLIRRTTEELKNNSTYAQKLKSFIKKYVLHKGIPVEDMIRWPKGILLLGLLRAGQTEVVCRYIGNWIKSGGKIFSPEDVLAGQVMLEIMETQHDRDAVIQSLEYNEICNYKKYIDNMAKYLASCECDEEGSLPYSIKAHNEHIYADSIGMICPFLMMYGINAHQQKYIDMAVLQISNFIKNAIDEKTGLPYHGYRYKDHEKYGIIGWGRAVGWLMMGIAGCLSLVNMSENNCDQINYGDKSFMTSISNMPQISEIMEEYKQLVDAVLEYQREDGLWGWNIPEVDSQTDTSASAMILYALSQYPDCKIKQNDHEVSEIIQRGMNGLEKYITKDGKVMQCQAECGGFGVYPEKFGSYPWSVGMTLAIFSSALI